MDDSDSERPSHWTPRPSRRPTPSVPQLPTALVLVGLLCVGAVFVNTAAAVAVPQSRLTSRRSEAVPSYFSEHCLEGTLFPGRQQGAGAVRHLRAVACRTRNHSPDFIPFCYVTESRIFDAYENELERERRVEFGCAFFKQFDEICVNRTKPATLFGQSLVQRDRVRCCKSSTRTVPCNKL